MTRGELWTTAPGALLTSATVCAELALSIPSACTPHTPGRLQRASTASLQALGALGTLEEGEVMEKLLRAARFCVRVLFPNRLPVHLLFLPVRACHFDPTSRILNPWKRFGCPRINEYSLEPSSRDPVELGSQCHVEHRLPRTPGPNVGQGSPSSRAGMFPAGDEGGGEDASAWDVGRLLESN